MKQQLLPVNIAQLRDVKGTENIIAAIKADKPCKCPCDDGAGSGTSTVNNVAYLCEGCGGNGWTAVQMKREPVVRSGKIVYEIKPMV